MMPDCDRLQDYAALLHTRHKAARRDATLTGAVFFLTMLAFVASGLLGELGGPSEYLMLAIITVLALAYLTAWVRFHTTKVVIDLVDALRREGMRR